MLFFSKQIFFCNKIIKRFFKIEFKNNTAEISVNDGLYQVKFYSPEMVETVLSQKPKLTEDSHARNSLQICKINFRETRGFAWIETSGITRKIQKCLFKFLIIKVMNS